MTVAKVQHYVPQFLLRNFGSGKKDQIWVYDKLTDKCFRTNTKNVASESRFYDFELGDFTVSIEPMLSSREAAAKRALARVLESDSVLELSPKEKSEIAIFLGLQMTRTRSFRQEWQEFPGQLRESLLSKGFTLSEELELTQLLKQPSENQSKIQTVRFMVESCGEFAKHFLNKEWLLVSTVGKIPFIISDNPITKQNANESRLRGNLGLASIGIELYFPISPTRAIAMWCPTIMKNLREKAHQLRNQPYKFRSHDETEVVSFAESIERGKPPVFSAESVENFNSLQVVFSERYIFSSSEDFYLARQMITSRPDIRTGPRATIR
jgi:Protein of unknown function (DUF4238)